MYNTISDNEAVYNEESSSILIKTPETTEIINDVEQAEAPEEEVVSEKEKEEDKEDDEKDTDGEVPMLDKEFDDEDDMGEDIELPKENKFTNDLDPQK